MKTNSTNIISLMFLIAACALAPGSFAESVRSGMELVDDAIEAEIVSMHKNKEGKIDELVAKECALCAPVAFNVSDSLLFFSGGVVISPEVAYKYNGKAGTVVFNAQTKLANKVILFSVGSE